MAVGSDVIRVKLPNNTEAFVQIRQLGGKEQVGLSIPSFSDLAKSIEGIASALAGAVERVKPRKATVEYGIEASIESGKLVALLCSGDTSANLKITLEWGMSGE